MCYTTHPHPSTLSQQRQGQHVDQMSAPSGGVSPRWPVTSRDHMNNSKGEQTEGNEKNRLGYISGCWSLGYMEGTKKERALQN